MPALVAAPVGERVRWEPTARVAQTVGFGPDRRCESRAPERMRLDESLRSPLPRNYRVKLKMAPHRIDLRYVRNLATPPLPSPRGRLLAVRTLSGHRQNQGLRMPCDSRWHARIGQIEERHPVTARAGETGVHFFARSGGIAAPVGDTLSGVDRRRGNGQ